MPSMASSLSGSAPPSSRMTLPRHDSTTALGSATKAPGLLSYGVAMPVLLPGVSRHTAAASFAHPGSSPPSASHALAGTRCPFNTIALRSSGPRRYTVIEAQFANSNSVANFCARIFTSADSGSRLASGPNTSP